jgi:four helix bundle protein
MNEEQLKQRTKKFTLQVIKLVGSLPRNIKGRAIGNQLIRSGTSVGANYRAACRSRSKAEFIAKMGIVEEEADETAYWLELIIEGNIMKMDIIKPLLQESNELVAIMAASRKSASRQK